MSRSMSRKLTTHNVAASPRAAVARLRATTIMEHETIITDGLVPLVHVVKSCADETTTTKISNLDSETPDVDEDMREIILVNYN